MVALNSKFVVCFPPLLLTLLLALFFWLTTVCSLSFPNCTSVLSPNRLLTPGTSPMLLGKETFPASISLIISSSLPSYFSFRFCAS